MLKNFKFVLSAFFAIALLASCASSGDDAKDAARQAIQPSTAEPAATPQTPNQPAAATPIAPSGPTTTMEFAETTFDFGTVVSGEKVSHIYTFTNSGSEPLIISNAKGSCGCTVPEWPREPIPAGGKGEIRVEFNSKGKGKVGGAQQSKKVTITANTDPTNTYLTIKGTVNKEAES